MDFDNITIGQIVGAIVSIGVICTFFFKIFSLFSKVKENEREIQELKKRQEEMEEKTEKQKNEILSTVNKTNEAVNLLCSAISAMIDNELSENKNIDELESVKRQLDAKKGIV